MSYRLTEYNNDIDIDKTSLILEQDALLESINLSLAHSVNGPVHIPTVYLIYYLCYRVPTYSVK